MDSSTFEGQNPYSIEKTCICIDRSIIRGVGFSISFSDWLNCYRWFQKKLFRPLGAKCVQNLSIVEFLQWVEDHHWVSHGSSGLTTSILFIVFICHLHLDL